MARAADARAVGMGDILPKIVWPSDVEKLKRDLEPAMQATDAAVQRCKALDAPTHAAWVAYREDWDSVLGFGSANRYDQGIAFQGELSRWQVVLRSKGCEIAGPAVVDPHANDESQATLIKFALGTVAIVAIAWGVHAVVR